MSIGYKVLSNIFREFISLKPKCNHFQPKHIKSINTQYQLPSTSFLNIHIMNEDDEHPAEASSPASSHCLV